MAQLSVWHNIFFNPNVGPDATLIIGLPGTGKSQFGTKIIKEATLRLNENWVMPGDINCEWANAAPYFDKVIIITPTNIEIDFQNIPQTYDDVREVDYNTINIMDYFTATDKRKLVVVYDEHLYGKLRFAKTKLWVKLFQQLLYRKILRRPQTIGLIFHEGSVYFPRQPIGEHWEAVMDFANLMVGARKNWIRLVLISQLEKHMINLIRELCLWRINRKGKISKMDNSGPLAGSTPFLALNEFNMAFGGVYRLKSTIEKLEEYNMNMQMIPMTPLEDYLDDYIDLSKQKEREEQERKRMELKEQEMEYKQQLKEEEKENKLYILEKEAEYKKELAELKHRQALEREEQKRKEKEERQRQKELEEQELIDKGVQVLMNDKDISVNSFGNKIGLTYFAKSKIIYEKCIKIISSSKQ